MSKKQPKNDINPYKSINYDNQKTLAGDLY